MLFTYVTRLTRLCLILALSAAPASLMAQNFNLCSYVTPLIPAAQANFLANGSALPLPPNANSCAMSLLLSGSRSYHCMWKFPYRAGTAREVFDGFNAAFENCLPGQMKIRNDQSVNHPDFYKRAQYQAGPVVIGISLKDRAQLHGSFVFLRITGATPQ